ncbi:unnamed protein product [Somion occarium]|uniref:Yeast cell wall synthesis Kre9/Knh1-like N-terminal domain-containing protein n=1 Tax=Somion occarium TaxID=3059160 RepID=A0ABP1CFF8_9APHY
MFALVSTLAVLVPFVSAFTFSTPTDWHSSSQVVANWTTLSTDPTSFSLELNNPDLFHQALALGNNVDTSSGTLSFALGVVPASSGYTLQAVNVTNINQIFAESAPFSILDPISTSSSASSTSSGLSSASSGTGSTRTCRDHLFHSFRCHCLQQCVFRRSDYWKFCIRFRHLCWYLALSDLFQWQRCTPTVELQHGHLGRCWSHYRLRMHDRPLRGGNVTSGSDWTELKTSFLAKRMLSRTCRMLSLFLLHK